MFDNIIDKNNLEGSIKEILNIIYNIKYDDIKDNEELYYEIPGNDNSNIIFNIKVDNDLSNNIKHVELYIISDSFRKDVENNYGFKIIGNYNQLKDFIIGYPTVYMAYRIINGINGLKIDIDIYKNNTIKGNIIILAPYIYDYEKNRVYTPESTILPLKKYIKERKINEEKVNVNNISDMSFIKLSEGIHSIFSPLLDKENIESEKYEFKKLDEEIEKIYNSSIYGKYEKRVLGVSSKGLYDIVRKNYGYYNLNDKIKEILITYVDLTNKIDDINCINEKYKLPAIIKNAEIINNKFLNIKVLAPVCKRLEIEIDKSDIVGNPIEIFTDKWYSIL
ncbi:hypothetical protein YN1_5300 [Nanoarchaeota archaeon]